MKRWNVTCGLAALAFAAVLAACRGAKPATGTESETRTEVEAAEDISASAADAGGEVQAERENHSTRRSCVTVVSGEETVIPVEYFNFSQSTETDGEGKEQFVSECGRYYKAEDVGELPTVSYSPELSVQTSETAETVACRLYNRSGTALGAWTDYQTTEEIRLPEIQEDYVVELRLTLAWESGISGYQEFFAVAAAPLGTAGN